jgi:hypothetical protein
MKAKRVHLLWLTLALSSCGGKEPPTDPHAPGAASGLKSAITHRQLPPGVYRRHDRHWRIGQ